MIEQLCERLDPLALRHFIVERGNFGKRPHPSGQPWGYTTDFMGQYGDPGDLQAVTSLFESLGLRDDNQAARWLLKYDKLVP